MEKKILAKNCLLCRKEIKKKILVLCKQEKVYKKEIPAKAIINNQLLLLGKILEIKWIKQWWKFMKHKGLICKIEFSFFLFICNIIEIK